MNVSASKHDPTDERSTLISKQRQLIKLYESIRTDYVSLFQHLYEIDENETIKSIDNTIVKG